jgi:hypothetical protein
MKLSDVNSKYGAPMGRAEVREAEASSPVRFYLSRVPLNSGGYDSGGAYWGLGRPVYQAKQVDGPDEFFLRAADREDAKAKIIKDYPNASFYR